LNQINLHLEVNGNLYHFSTRPNRTLLEVLREDLALTGVKDACDGEGECGACTVIMDGKPVNSCLVLIGQAEGCSIETIEGLAKDGRHHPLQSAFVEAGAVQCGFCTPGVIMSSKSLLERVANPDDETIREALSGNLCRCTGFTKIVKAVHLAAEEISHEH
jgi:aerobic carbon-monoxide dehydrogenase small subunit